MDLLLGLAKTRSGKRAAEEEQRQLRLQQHRELEEQKIAARTGSGTSSPWGYVAPPMPGLDVQQPFGNRGPRRVPRPLQPPPPKRPSAAQEWSTDLMDSIMRQPPTFSPASESPVPGSRDSYPSSIQQISPYQSMTGISLLSPGQELFSQPPQMDGMQQFGSASLNGFDFGDLGFGLPQASVENAPFNPFALAQTVEEGYLSSS